MKLLSDKEKVNLPGELKPMALSFARSTYEDDDDSSISFYLYCIDEDKKERHFIDVLEICPETESIIFNYYLTKKQIKDILELVVAMDLEEEIDKYIIGGLYKLLAVMCIEYEYDQSEIDKYTGEYVEIKEGLFSEIVNSTSVYFEKHDKDRIGPKMNKEEKYEYEEEDSLEEFGVNLINIDYKYDPAVGRNDEIKDSLVALMQGSCVLVGEPGVGKTAIVEGISYRIKTGKIPDNFKNKEIYEISTTELVSGCRYVGDLEEKMKDILNDVMLRGNVILFIDEMHTAIGTGKGSEGTLDIANIIKPYIDRGQIKMIGATTKEEYDEHIGKDPAFRRRLEKVVINEPDDNSLYKIIDNYINGEQKVTKVKFNNKVINRNVLINKLIELTKKSHRNYIDVEYNPGLVISIIKRAFSYAMYYGHKNLEITDLMEAIDKCNYLYQPPKDRFKERKYELKNKNNTKKTQKKKVLTFPNKN